MKDLEIIEYDDKYQDALKELSMEWLLKYDLLEPEDEKIINNPREVVLEGGGNIFLALFNGEIVGTASLIRIDECTFELAKLAVTDRYQGLGIGKCLMDKCIDTARIKNAKKVILYSNHRLISAISLYKKYRFQEVDITNNKYIESDIKMELII